MLLHDPPNILAAFMTIFFLLTMFAVTEAKSLPRVMRTWIEYRLAKPIFKRYWTYKICREFSNIEPSLEVLMNIIFEV